MEKDYDLSMQERLDELNQKQDFDTYQDSSPEQMGSPILNNKLFTASEENYMNMADSPQLLSDLKSKSNDENSSKMSSFDPAVVVNQHQNEMNQLPKSKLY